MFVAFPLGTAKYRLLFLAAPSISSLNRNNTVMKYIYANIRSALKIDAALIAEVWLHSIPSNFRDDTDSSIVLVCRVESNSEGKVTSRTVDGAIVDALVGVLVKEYSLSTVQKLRSLQNIALRKVTNTKVTDAPNIAP